MKQLCNYGDERQLARCVYCAGRTETRDHVPSKVLLDEPYPENLPVVPACGSCNAGFSLDEEYLACLVDCVLTGSVDAHGRHRDKIQRILARKPALALRLTQGRTEANGEVAFVPEADRVRNVVLKLARGHVAFELNEPQLDEPDALSFVPLALMDPDTRTTFESPRQTSILPEVGSRAMQRVVVACQGEAEWIASADWITVQAGRYRYMADVGDGAIVRVVLSEYLGCEVVWS